MKNFLSGLREFLRAVFVALLAWLLTDGVVAFFIDLKYGTVLDPQTRIMLVMGIGSVLKGVEKWMYKARPDNKLSGVLEFRGVK